MLIIVQPFLGRSVDLAGGDRCVSHVLVWRCLASRSSGAFARQQTPQDVGLVSVAPRAASRSKHLVDPPGDRFGYDDAHETSETVRPLLVSFVVNSAHRSCGGMFSTRANNAAISARSYLRCTRFVEAGRLARETPARHSDLGRIGRFSNPPPQFGQTLCKWVSTQVTQKVHS
jgi:hypothetical protein